MNEFDLRNGDCLEEMARIPDRSIDVIICDPPYGTTSCKWDSIIHFDSMWDQLKRIIKKNGPIVMTASQPFTSALVMSNIKMFKYADVWHKSHATGHLNAKIMTMREHEDILIFGNGRLTYNPQITEKPLKNIRPPSRRGSSECYGAFKENSPRSIPDNMQYPRSVVKINNTNHGERGLHPTQKPVALMEYLVKTYSNEGGVVLDFTMGSGTTGVACANTGRSFIGIEKDETYFNIAKERITKVNKNTHIDSDDLF